MISDALSALSTAGNLALVIIGFGALIFVHELGHFLAARWAGVRAHEFSIGFGPALCSFRKGLGFKIGSTNAEYMRRLKKTHGSVRPEDDVPGVSATEYRLNLIPFGGYVKMLGQDDSDPTATSEAPDAYNKKPVWKRMIIISGGVFMNVVTAATLFVVVFMVGLEQPAPVVGDVRPGLPAEKAAPADGSQPGLRAGDRVVSINGKPTPTFNYVSVAAAMARPGQELTMVVDRDGALEPLTYTLTPEREGSRGVVLGIDAAASGTIGQFRPTDREIVDRMLTGLGLDELESGSTLVSVGGAPAETYHAIDVALTSSDGRPVELVFENPDGTLVSALVAPRASMQISIRKLADNSSVVIEHILGLTPPMVVEEVSSQTAKDAGLLAGDMLARVGDVEWPDAQEAMRQIRAKSSERIGLLVARDGEYISIDAPVNGDGQVGFLARTPIESPSILTRTAPATDAMGEAIAAHAADSLDLPPGARILEVNGSAVETYTDLRSALQDSTAGADGSLEVALLVRLPIGSRYGDGPTETVEWSVPGDQAAIVAGLGWTNPLSPGLFRLETVELKAEGPIGALRMGITETHRIVTLTYLTLLRLVQGSVQIEQLRGPVGITHIGTQVVRDGVINLLFFLAVISINLAVLNFLPLPIVDGGHMVFLAIEGLTGKPVSVAVQNLAALVGLALVGGLFLLITFNDIKNLIGV